MEFLPYNLSLTACHAKTANINLAKKILPYAFSGYSQTNRLPAG